MKNNDAFYLSCQSRLGKDQPLKVASPLNIYFSYSKEDQGVIDFMFATILKIYKDATIYYIDYQKFPTIDSHDIKHLLKEMTVALFFTTPNYFNSENNNSCLNELEIFKGLNIPLLPIVPYQSVISKYNEKFGTLHFIGWDESNGPKRLERALNKIFEDNQIETSRYESNEKYYKFTKYVFFSYRRMDKDALRDLVTSIHSDQRNLDVAIWFDDFLIPGKEFKDGIKDKINKADLCLFLITPHILEGDNYIKTDEFKDVKEAHKPYIPVLLEEVDLDELERAFPGMGKPIPYQDLPNVIATFYKDQQHELNNDELFSLGLSYLFGNTVERNSELGLSLIKKAALTNTRHRYYLATLYHQGPYVPIDNHEYLKIVNKLFYEDLHYHYQSLNDDDNIFFDFAVNLVKTQIKLYGRNEETNKLIKDINDKFNEFKFKEDTDDYDKYVIAFSQWYITYGHEVDERGIPMVAMSFIRVWDKAEDKEPYYNLAVDVFTRFLAFMTHDSDVSEAISFLLNESVKIANTLIKNDPFYVFKNHSWIELATFMCKFNEGDPIAFLDGILDIVNNNVYYSDDFGTVAKIIYVKKIDLLKEISLYQYQKEKEIFLSQYGLPLESFNDIDYVLAAYYYDAAIASLYDYERYDLAFNKARDYLHYLGKNMKYISNLEIEHYMIRCLGSLADTAAKIGDFKAAKKYFDDWMDLFTGVDHKEVMKQKSRNNLLTTEIIIRVKDHDLEGAKQLAEDIFQMSEKDEDWFTFYVVALITYAEEANDEQYLIDELGRLQFEDSWPLYLISSRVINNAEKLPHAAKLYFEKLEKECEKIIKTDNDVMDYLLGPLSKALIYNYIGLNDEEMTLHLKKCFSLMNDFIRQSPHLMDESLLGNYNLIFFLLGDKIFENEEEYQKFCLETCECASLVWKTKQDYRLVNYFTCFVAANAILCIQFGLQEVLDQYGEEVLNIRSHAITDIRFILFRQEKLSDFRMSVVLSILHYDMLYQDKPMLTVQDLTYMSIKFLNFNNFKDLKLFHALFGSDSGEYHPLIKRYLAMFLKIDLMVKDALDQKVAAYDLFEEHGDNLGISMLLDDYIKYLRRQNVDEQYITPFEKLLVKDIAALAVDENEKISANEMRTAFEKFDLNNVYLMKKIADFDEKEQFYLINYGIIFYEKYRELIPNGSSIAWRYYEQISHLLEHYVRFGRFERCIEDFKEYCTIDKEKGITVTQHYFYCLFFYALALRYSSKDKNLIRETYLELFNYWKLMLRVDINLDKMDYLHDTLVYLTEYDPDNYLFYAKIIYVLFNEDEGEEDTKLTFFDDLAAHYLENGEFGVAIYFYEAFLKYINDHNIDKKDYIKGIYLRLGQAHEFMGNIEKSEHYYDLMSRME